MSKRDPQLLIDDIIDSIEKIKSYTGQMEYSEFVEDEKTKDAVIRNFEIIGEAANRLGDDFRKDHHDIEWNRIRGFRNRIVHHYFGIDYEIVWSIIQNNLDRLQNKLIELRDQS
jgi:uncharacterized protein with HEPN domain